MKRLLILVPLALFAVLAIFLGIGLNRDPHTVPSPLIGKAAPAFSLPQLESGAPFSPKEMLGKVWLLNVWATWCAPCREEHPVLVDFAKTQTAPMIGLDYKDKGADAKAWLARFGNPYEVTVVDADGRVGIDYGVYGVPETYVIDKAGVIRFKQIGPVTRSVMQDKIVPLIKELQK
jgi:cytochrome c biogenesis protein CcmG, thiol:disulfide interchange protein DsbE